MVNRIKDRKVLPLRSGTKSKRADGEALAKFRAVQRCPTPEVPKAELDLLCKAALGNTDQSRTCRYLLSLLAGAGDPAGSKGEGLLEMRSLDRKLSDAFLMVVDWWRGPTESDEPLYDLLARIAALKQDGD